MIVDLEKILSPEKIITANATEYVATQEEKILENYIMVGVHVNLRNYTGNPRSLILLSVPPETEVVVGYICNLNSASGTALIPKQEKNK